jgi:3beta-hydroxy-Delta5-steroid dehydrogenase / steroid Delta-isomerase
MKRVLVTGACGFTGRNLVAHMLEGGYSVHACDVIAEDKATTVLDDAIEIETGKDRHGFGKDVRLSYSVCDVSSSASVAAAFEAAGTVHAVFHTAAIVPFNLSWDGSNDRLFAVNVMGTHNVVEASKAAGVRQLVFASSSGVVFSGKEDLFLVDESHPIPTEWNDSYSESKARAEEIVLRASDPDGLACVALRPNGEHQGDGTVAHTECQMARRNLGHWWGKPPHPQGPEGCPAGGVWVRNGDAGPDGLHSRSEPGRGVLTLSSSA